MRQEKEGVPIWDHKYEDVNKEDAASKQLEYHDLVSKFWSKDFYFHRIVKIFKPLIGDPDQVKIHTKKTFVTIIQ